MGAHNGRVPASAQSDTHTDSPAATPSRWPAGLFLLGLAVYLATAARSTLSLDVWAAYFASWRITSTGAPWVDGMEIPGISDHPTAFVWLMTADNGHEVIGRSPGVIAAGLPAYLVDAGGPSMVPGALTAAVLTALSLALFYGCVRPQLGWKQAALAAGALGFTTPVWSVAANGIWPHTITVFGILGMAWAVRSERWWLAGLFGAVVLWGRLHAVVIVALLGLVLAILRRRPGIAIRIGIVSGLGLAGLCVWDRWMYGSWSPLASYEVARFSGQASDYASDGGRTLLNQLGFWVSPDRGILIWTPVLLVLLPALVRSWRSLPDWSKVLLASGIAYTVLQGMLNRFSGGDSFYGYRLGLEFLACAAPAFALAARDLRKAGRAALGPVLGIQLVAIGTGAVSDSHFVAAEDVWSTNAFLAATGSPVALAGLLLVSAAVGFLTARICTNPRLERPQTAKGLRKSG